MHYDDDDDYEQSDDDDDDDEPSDDDNKGIQDDDSDDIKWRRCQLRTFSSSQSVTKDFICLKVISEKGKPYVAQIAQTRKSNIWGFIWFPPVF